MCMDVHQKGHFNSNKLIKDCESKEVTELIKNVDEAALLWRFSEQLISEQFSV